MLSSSASDARPSSRALLPALSLSLLLRVRALVAAPRSALAPRTHSLLAAGHAPHTTLRAAHDADDRGAQRRPDGPAHRAPLQPVLGQRRHDPRDCWRRLLCHRGRHAPERGILDPDALCAEGLPIVSDASLGYVIYLRCPPALARRCTARMIVLARPRRWSDERRMT